MIGFGIVIPLLPFYVQSMGGSAEVVGLILGSFSLTQMMATPVLGRLSDRYGRRPVILLSLAGNALSMVIFAIAAERALLPWLFVSRILAGATAGNLAACQAAVADVTDGPERAAGMGRLGAGIGLGLVIGPVLGAALSQLHPSAPPLAAAALAISDLIGAYVFMPETRAVTGASAPAEPDTRSLAQALADRRIVSVMAIYFLTFLCMTQHPGCSAAPRARASALERARGRLRVRPLRIHGVAGARRNHRPAVAPLPAGRILVGGALCVAAGMTVIAAARGRDPAAPRRCAHRLRRRSDEPDARDLGLAVRGPAPPRCDTRLRAIRRRRGAHRRSGVERYALLPRRTCRALRVRHARGDARGRRRGRAAAPSGGRV